MSSSEKMTCKGTLRQVFIGVIDWRYSKRVRYSTHSHSHTRLHTVMGDTNGKRKGDQRSPQHEVDPARKVMRNGSDLDSSFDFCERLTSMMDQYKGKMTATLTLMDMEKNPGMTEVKD
jgi:hypothetical protein